MSARGTRGAGRPRPAPAASDRAGRGVEPAVQRAPPERGWGPSALLRPEREIVPFGGRAAERAALRDWCAGLPPHSVRVLLGTGGVGKTRLARQAAADWAAQAEPSQVVQPGDEPLAAAAARTAGPGRPLLVVDEAESREGLAALLAAALTGPGEARVLLVARSLGDWWDLLVEDCPPSVARVLTEAPPLRLGTPLSPGVADADVAAAAVPHFAAAMSLELPGHAEVERSALRLPVLLLQAAALLAVLRSAADGPAPARVVTGPYVLDELLEHELRYWRTSAAAAGLAYDAERVTHAVTVVTLAGPPSLEEAELLMARVPELTGETPDRLVEWADWVAGLYPPGPNGQLGGLRPDPVAETLVTRQLAGDPVLARRFLRALPPEQAVHAICVLARAGADDREAARLLREALHYDLPQLAGPAALAAQRVPGELAGLLRDALYSTPAAPQTLAEIARGLPRPSPTIADAELIAILRAREALAAAGADGLADWDDRAADVLSWLDGRVPARDERAASGPLGWPGDPRGAGPSGSQWPGDARFGAARDAASQARQGQAELASALTNLAVRGSERDRPQDARRAGQQAVRLYRGLAADEPETYLPELAASLANFAVWLAEVSTPEEAVPPTRQAAGMLRRLADADPRQFGPDLATCLANLSIWYTRAGQPADALAAQHEAASILRELTLADPGHYQAELAVSLTNLGTCYSRAGRADEAVPAEREAVAIRRELAAADPGRYRAGLASSLTNLASRQAELGRQDEAVEAAQDAVTVYRDLAAPGTAGHRRDLARALANLGVRQRELGDHEAALEALGEAVSILRRLAATDPRRNRAGLASTLASLAAVLAELGRQDEARVASAEADALAAKPGRSRRTGAGRVRARRGAPPVTAPTRPAAGTEPEPPTGSPHSTSPAAREAPSPPAARAAASPRAAWAARSSPAAGAAPSPPAARAAPSPPAARGAPSPPAARGAPSTPAAGAARSSPAAGAAPSPAGGAGSAAEPRRGRKRAPQHGRTPTAGS